MPFQTPRTLQVPKDGNPDPLRAADMISEIFIWCWYGPWAAGFLAQLCIRVARNEVDLLGSRQPLSALMAKYENQS